jgi:holo-[acyl-carrier protein] synthase
VITPPDLAGVAGVVGVGIDVVDVDRFRRVLERTPRLVERVFAPGEREAGAARPDPAEFFAARFAAKEAVLKVLAHGIFELPLPEIEVRGGGEAAPWLALGPTVSTAARSLGISAWRLSLTHSGGVAAAVAVGLI